MGKRGRPNDKRKPPLAIHPAEDGTPVAGVGPGIGLTFVTSLFPLACDKIRIASAYFTLSGYRVARPHIVPGVQLHVLVGREEGASLRKAVIEEILDDLKRADMNLWDAVADLVARMKAGTFVIRDAREIETPFHCKFYICDSSTLWHGSANYTESGLRRNAEQASVSRERGEIEQFSAWYDSVAADAIDLLVPLRERLEAWLNLANPFDVYLLTLLRLQGLPEVPIAEGGHRAVYYQRAVVSQALRQIESHRGALAVVATGLGKTVIGAEVAHRLHMDGSISRVVVVAPASVHDDWGAQLEARRVPAHCFSPDSLFRRANAPRHHRAGALDIQLKFSDSGTLLIIDEAHFARNQLLTEEATRRPSRVYRRLGKAVSAGARVLLLTATPYGTNAQNLRSLLHLLPPTSSGGLGLGDSWVAPSIEEFLKLDVVTVMGFPHLITLARRRGDVDERQRPFVAFRKERRFFPRTLKLRVVQYRLPLEKEMVRILSDGLAESTPVMHVWADDAGDVQRGVTDPVVNATVLGWLSSPPALIEALRRNLATPGKGQLELPQLLTHFKEPQYELALAVHGGVLPGVTSAPSSGLGHRTRMSRSLAERQQHIEPVMRQLEDVRDDKLAHLGPLVHRHCVDGGEKMLIYARKPRTALYLEEQLRATFGNTLGVASTAKRQENTVVLQPQRRRAALRRQFSPVSHGADKPSRNIDVLICTDADAEGVSLQDASVVVNYDLPDGADTLFQRVGRVLRLTANADRDITFYTLVPDLPISEPLTARVSARIENMIARLMRRHERSASVLRAPVLPSSASEDRSLDVDAATYLADQEKEVGWEGHVVASPADHQIVLEQHAARAAELRGPIQSAKAYPSRQRLVFVLIEERERVVPILYNIDRERLEARADMDVLGLIACEPEEPRAYVAGAEVERWSNTAVQAWCADSGVSIGDVRKVCCMYLKPELKSSASIEQIMT